MAGATVLIVGKKRENIIDYDDLSPLFLPEDKRSFLRICLFKCEYFFQWNAENTSDAKGQF